MSQASSRTHQVKTIGLLIPTLLAGEIEGWRNTGWAGVTQTTSELLNYWFQEERDGASFHLSGVVPKVAQNMSFQTKKILSVKISMRLMNIFSTI